MRKYGLIGYPLGHSFSKEYFAEKFSREKIDEAVYDNYPIEDIAKFEPLYKGDPDLKGLNVTIPYKEQIIPYLDVLSEDARDIGAVNTVCLCTKTGRLVKVGHNTDVPGFRKSLLEQLNATPQQAIVLGTGGSSKAVVCVLEEMGVEVIRVSSSGQKGAIGYGDLAEKLVKNAKLIVNTTPLGMHPEMEGFPDIPYDALTTDHLLFDLVYNPAVTRFMQMGRNRGASAVNGRDMLVYQAEEAWEIWNRE
ncbi:MAG: shikimate dehydrogenase [Bacteroidales bacterium]